MQQIKALQQLLSTPQKIVITTHYKPDADALGSSLAMSAYLKKKGHQVTVITPSDYPRFLKWMHGEKEVIAFKPDKKESITQYFEKADIIFYLDFSSLSRLEEMEDCLKHISAKTVMIDHHVDPSIQADFTLWDTHAAATAQLVYNFIDMMGEKHLIDIPTGEAIYAGILTDSGSFKFPNTSKEVHMIAGEMIDLGVNTSRIHHLIYDNNTENRLRFLGYVLSEKLTVLHDLNTAYFVITQEELKRYQYKTGDSEGFVNYALSIEGITMAAIIIDRVEKIKMSFRSVGDFPVNEFAKEHFNGGGHKNAAGGSTDLSLEETEKKFLSLLPQYKKQLCKV